MHIWEISTLTAIALLLTVFDLADSQTCSAGWSQYGSYCYRVSAISSEQYISWNDASDTCASEGAYLASIHSIGEQDFLVNLAKTSGITVGMWLGFTRKDDPSSSHKWTDGTPVDYTYWATGEPKADGLSNCAYTVSSETSSTFQDYTDTSTTYYIPGFDYPAVDADGVDTFYFGTGSSYDINWCKGMCAENPRCYAYNWCDYNCWESYWAYTCTGRSNAYSNLDYLYGHDSGIRTTPDLSQGWWLSENCGVKMALACKKPAAPITIAPVTPTKSVESYCPSDYLGVGNKCFKVVKVTDKSLGFTWQAALDMCRNEPYSGADLASIHTENENAVISSRLEGNGLGVWLGGHYEESYRSAVWSDNSDMDFMKWNAGEPSSPTTESCMQMMQTKDDGGNWNDYGCTQTIGYVCQIYKDADNPVNTPPVPETTCPFGWVPYRDTCYKLDSFYRTWQEAKDNCLAQGAELVSIHESAQNAAVFLTSGKYRPFWIGLHLDTATQQYVWASDWPVNYLNWDATGPTSKGCAVMNANQEWTDTVCTEKLASVCWTTTIQQPTTPYNTPGSCPSYDWIEYGSYCYFFHITAYPASWDEALADCKTIAPNTNVSLASVHDYLENQFIYNQLRTTSTYYQGWLGLKRINGAFQWSDNSQVEFTNWAPGEPNNGGGTGIIEDCVEIQGDSAEWPALWNDIACTTYSKTPICKVPKGPPPTTPDYPTPAPGNCPSGEWVKYGSECLLFRPTLYSTWSAAQTYCQNAAGSNSYLTSIHDSAKNYFIQDRITELASSEKPNIWIGLSKATSGQPYLWNDGTVVDYVNWSPGEPNDSTGYHNCVRLYYGNGLWDDYDCYDALNLGFVCEIAVSAQGYDIPHNANDVPQAAIQQPSEQQAKSHVDDNLARAGKSSQDVAQAAVDDEAGDDVQEGCCSTLMLILISSTVVAAVVLAIGAALWLYAKKKSTVTNGAVDFNNPLSTVTLQEYEY